MKNHLITIKRSGQCEPVVLAVIFLLAAVVRLIGPISEPALGQSDAYAHLQFLNDMAHEGHLRHSLYPPGFYWIAAIPVKLFDVDAYLVARYGGVFFGLGQLMAVYVLARLAFGVSAALWSSFLLAAFPLFHWLQKTGVGLYPSQFGLLLLPLVVASWDSMMRNGLKCFPKYCLPVLALTVSVPMMLVDLIPFLLIDAMVRFCRKELTREGAVAVAIISVLSLFVVAFIWVKMGEAQFFGLASMVAGQPLESSSTSGRMIELLWLYLRPERVGYSSAALNVASCIAGVVLGILYFRLDANKTLGRSLVLWCLVAWLQTTFGCFQFGQYLRAGWVLLLIGVVLAGWLTANVKCWLPEKWGRRTQCLIIIASLASFTMPPTPRPHLSPAESDLIIALRNISAWARDHKKNVTIAELNELDPRIPTRVWSRTFNGYHGRQGDPVPAFLERLTNVAITTANEGPDFERFRQHVVLLDDRVELQDSFGLMAMLNPALVNQFISAREGLMAENQLIRQEMGHLDANTWITNSVVLEGGLEIMVLKAEGAGVAVKPSD